MHSFLVTCEVGEPIFRGFSPSRALRLLRGALELIGVVGAERYRTQDLRRGHARDLQDAGVPLQKILFYGEWTSPAFLSYLDVQQLEAELVLNAHMDESSDSDCERV